MSRLPAGNALQQVAQSSQDVADRLNELRRALELAQQEIGATFGSELARSFRSSVLGTVQSGLQASLSALGQGLGAGARDAFAKYELAQAQAVQAASRGQMQLAAALQAAASASLTASVVMQDLARMAAFAGLGLEAIPGIVSLIRGTAGLASPSAESTLAGHLDLLAATVGSDLIPALKTLALAVHASKNAYMSSGLSTLVNIGSNMAVGEVIRRLYQAEQLINAVRQMAGYDPVKLLEGFKEDTVFPGKPGYTTAAQHADDIQTAVLAASGQQTQQDLLKLQLQNLADQKKLLEQIRDRQPPIPISPWRG